MKKTIPLSELADKYPIMVTLYPTVFALENLDLTVLNISELDEVLNRIDTFKTMMDMNKKLLLILYETEKAFYIHRAR